MSDLITIIVCNTLAEAHIVRGRLEAEHIFAALADASDMANVRVLVRKEDAAQAIKIVREANASSKI